MEPLETPERALVFTPHPDDAEGGCGGTVIKWVNEGAEVFLVLATDGRAGTSDPNVSMEELVVTREREQAEAAAVMGIKEVVNLRNPDGGLEDTREFRGQLVEAIRRFKPDVVLTTEPYHRLQHSHRDHRMIGVVAQDACFPYARDTLHYEEHLRDDGLSVHKVGAALLWGTENPDVAINISDTIGAKIEALAKHESQLSLARDDMEEFVRRWAKRAADRAEGTGYAYAEAFRKIEFRR